MKEHRKGLWQMPLQWFMPRETVDSGTDILPESSDGTELTLG
jgi:hypothetical protein